LNTLIKKFDSTFFRNIYPLIFAIPLNIFFIGDRLGTGIQWAFFRFQMTANGNSFIPITNSLLFVKPGRSALGEYLLFFGILSLVISYILLYYRTPGSVRKAGMLTVFGSVLVLYSCMAEYGVLLSGPAGTSLPVGIPFILALGILMYRYTPENPEIPRPKKRKAGSHAVDHAGSISPENNAMKTDPPVTPDMTTDYYLSLILLNFVTNFIFLTYYGFVADDWSTLSPINAYSEIPISQLLFESRRPVAYIIFKHLPIIFGNDQVIFFLLNFIISSILLLMVFIVIKSLLSKITPHAASGAFLITILYCILFNKAELYAFGTTISLNIAFILYFVSFYFFLNADKKPYYLVLSLLSFTLALFTYELGIILLIVYLVYAFYYEKSVKKALAFFIPVIFYALVVLTNWFGHGFRMSTSGGITASNFFSVLSFDRALFYLRVNLEFTASAFWTGIDYGILGLKSLPFLTIILLIIFNGVVVFAILRVLARHFSEEPEIPASSGYPLILSGLAGIVFSFLLICINGATASRYMIFIDIFACLILVVIALRYIRKPIVVNALFFLMVFCLLINQGLFFNYVASHNIQQSVNDAIYENAGNISQYNMVFFDIGDLKLVRGTHRNAIGLFSWSIKSMMQNAGIDTSNRTLVYNVDGEDFGSFRVLDSQTIKNGSFFTFNRTNVNLDTIYSL
jgi:hypothetical protein